ncbi:MAG: hypothetical protein ACE5LS_05370 [Thermoplasmata archaeon]
MVVLLATLAIAGMSLPVLVSQPGMRIPPAIGASVGGATADDGDNSGPGDGDDGDDGDEADDDDEDEFEDEEREVTVEIVDNEVTILLESTSLAREDQVKVHFDAVEAEMKVSFEVEATQEEEVEMRIEYRELFEFEDDGDGAFSPLDDEIRQTVAIGTLPILDLRNSPFDTGAQTGQRINVTYAFPGSSGGTFELVFWVLGLVTEIDGVPLRPTETKIDIRITNFPFLSTTSRLALGLEVKTEFELEDPGVTFEQVTATGEEFTAFFRWMPDAVTVDGTPASAVVTIVRQETEVEVRGDEGESENETRLFLAYPQGSAIVHDPKVGILAVAGVVLPVLGPSLAVYGVGLATALLLVLGVWAWNRRRP